MISEENFHPLIIKLQLHDAIYRLRFYSNLLIHRRINIDLEKIDYSFRKAMDIVHGSMKIG